MKTDTGIQIQTFSKEARKAKAKAMGTESAGPELCKEKGIVAALKGKGKGKGKGQKGYKGYNGG